MLNGTQRSGIALAEIAIADAKVLRSPRISPEAEVLATRIERAVRRKTNGKVYDLKVEVHRDRIVLMGHCGTFYCKQLAQQAALSLSDGRELRDEIEVW